MLDPNAGAEAEPNTDEGPEPEANAAGRPELGAGAVAPKPDAGPLPKAPAEEDPNGTVAEAKPCADAADAADAAEREPAPKPEEAAENAAVGGVPNAGLDAPSMGVDPDVGVAAADGEAPNTAACVALAAEDFAPSVPKVDTAASAGGFGADKVKPEELPTPN
mmetsp:Transcript_9871/g.30159  ORF Transcript_9871/g.30159 Transcript_9871/m.30159 type:complete len:163 (-) Transcript_9871:1096-1584(-)